MDEQSVGMGDKVAIQQINRKVALETGHLPKRQRTHS